MMLFKVKAGALQFTMYIVVVIALLLSAFTILIHTYKTFRVQTDFVMETIDLAERGINYTLQDNIVLNDTVSVNLRDEAYKSLKVHQGFWGIFRKVASVAHIKNKTFKKVALIGTSQPDIDRTALYLEERNRPLVVVGNAKIQGVAHLPKQGVRTGNISGHAYYGNALIYGKEKTSAELPKLDPESLRRIKGIEETYKNIDSNQFLDLGLKKTFQNSFYNPLNVVYSPNSINLSGVSLTGHIVVQSEARIVVDALSALKDVILIAPVIEVKNHTKGRFQAFASKKIIIGEQCELGYPSALVLHEKSSVSSSSSANKENPSIKLEKRSVLKGCIAFLGTSKSYKSHVFIAEHVTVIGEVYCNQNLELLGKVYGSVFTSGFVASQSGSVYQNHLYNGVITINKLPHEYVGLPFVNTKKGLAKWLY